MLNKVIVEDIIKQAKILYLNILNKFNAINNLETNLLNN